MTGAVSRLRPDGSTRARHSGAGTPAADGTIALLPIGADLLPTRTTTGRGGRRRTVVAAGIVLVAVIALAGGYLAARHDRSEAATALAAAQDQQHGLQVQQRSFDDLVRTRSQATRLQSTLATVMRTDTPWSVLLDGLAHVRGGVTLTAVNAAVATAATPAGPATAPGALGTVTITGSAPDKPTISTFVDALGGLAGLADPFLSTVTAGSGTAGFTFTVTVDLTHDLSSAAVSRWATTAGGGK